jgi:hypothetical protein
MRFVVWMLIWEAQHKTPPRARDIADAHGVHMNTATSWRRHWYDARRLMHQLRGIKQVDTVTFRLDPDRLSAAGKQILQTMTAIQNEQGYPSAEVVGIALYVVGSALAQIGAVIPADGLIDKHLGALLEGYRDSFKTLSRQNAN